MGLCLSKKKLKPPPSPPADEMLDKRKETKKKVVETPDRTTVVAEVPAEKKLHVLVAAPTPKKSAAASSLAAGDEKKKGETPAMLARKESATGGIARGDAAVVGVSVEDLKPAPVRTSSCTKEEVDAILIQCGRLSRSSSGTGIRRYAGSKRSYDFDNEKKPGEEEEEEEEGEDWGGRPVSRPSPRRRTPGRDRSWSRERSGSGAAGGGRRVSRSPGRRSETPAASGSARERSRQPSKMVSVPAREKAGRGVSPTAAVNRRGSEMGAAKAASPRSPSPANACRVSNENALHQSASLAKQPQSLGRSSPRKAEQSPCGRSPMAEIHENTLRRHHNTNHEYADLPKTTQVQSQYQKSSENSAPTRKPEPRAGGGAAEASNIVKPKQVLSERTKEQEMEPEIVEEAMKKSSWNDTVETLNEGTATRIISRTRSSRRCSRDLDHCLGGFDLASNPLHPSSYTSMLLEDIQKYHQQHQGGAFSLPACLSKACSILDAVADLNSASSENKKYEDDRSANGNVFSEMYGKPKDPFMESEIVVKDDLMEPSLHKYVTVRDFGCEMEPQESAGSNSFVGQPWASPWGPDSLDSSDPCWTSSSINGDEVDQEHNLQRPARSEASRELEARARRTRGGSGSNSFMAPTSSSKRRELQHHSQLQRAGSSSSSITVASGRMGGKRAYSLSATAAASS